MIDQILTQHQENFKKALEHFAHELSGVRTGRANPGLLNTVQVESYGSKMPIEHVATVMASDARTLTISPFDPSQIPAIEKGIQVANLGFNPSSDGKVVRITLPALNEERRKEMVKLVGQITEKGKIGIRNAREGAHKEMKKAEGDGKISKDDLQVGQKKLQEVVDKYNEEIKKHSETKEKEIMTV
ncbi:MAG TPA: ribosome recycling factor [Candidatus Limnocylindria bacterium]|nr:ribosome recycling factor [Candidatus Limnocylindria bacterium]